MRNNQKRNADKQEKKALTEQEQLEQRLKNINNRLQVLPIASWEYPRVLLSVLKERSISYADQVFDSLYMIAMQGVQPLFINYTRTDLARNKLAVEFLKSPFTHLIMLDIDHKHPADIVQKLSRWFLLRPEVQIVGGLNFRRSYPHDPCCHLIGKDGNIYAPAEWDRGGLLEVAAIGTGSIMIAREVFETIQPPWFFNIYDNVWDDSWPGEDMGFSQKCREYGIKMYVDTDLTSPHVTEKLVDESSFREAISKGDLEIMPLKGGEICR